MPLISIVVPSYNEEVSLRAFHKEVASVVAAMPNAEAEFIFVDDGSADDTLAVIKSLRQADPRVRYVSFSRHFGKEAGLFAGLTYAHGDFVVIMDADLQDPPRLLPEMYAAVTDGGFDCAATRRSTRNGESRIRTFFAESFYRVFNALSDTELRNGARDFRLMSRKMVDAVLELCEVNRFSKGLLAWVGFKTTWIDYENVERVAGSSSWSFFGLARYSIEGIINFSTAPLAFASALGFLFCLAAFVWVVVIVIRTTVFGNPTPGWSSLACIVLFASGMQFFTIGILGQYLARTYIETKRRPVFIVRETEE